MQRARRGMQSARRGMQQAYQFVENLFENQGETAPTQARSEPETEPTQARSEPETRTKLECAKVRLAFATIFLSDDSTFNYLPYDIISEIGGILSDKLLKVVIPKCEEEWIKWCNGRDFQNLSKVLGGYTLTFEDLQPGKCFHYKGGNKESSFDITGEFRISGIKRRKVVETEEFVLHVFGTNGTSTQGRSIGIVLRAEYYTEKREKPAYLKTGWNVEQLLLNHVNTFKPISC